MVFLSDIIKANIHNSGLEPILVSGKRVIRQFICPECKAIKLVKFIKPGGKARKSECVCGYVHYTKGWKHRRPLIKAFKTGLRKASTTI